MQKHCRWKWIPRADFVNPKNILLVHSLLLAPKPPRGAGLAMVMSMGPVAMRVKRAAGSAAVTSALRTVRLRFASPSSAGSGTGGAQRPEWGPGGTSSNASTPATKDCILLAACGANETLPHNTKHIYTSCFTTWSKGCNESLTAACLGQSIGSLHFVCSLPVACLSQSIACLYPVCSLFFVPSSLDSLHAHHRRWLHSLSCWSNHGIKALSETLECCRY